MIDLTETQEELRRTARELASGEIAAAAAEHDAEETFPARSYELCREHGLIGACVPVEYGGRGCGVFEAVLVLEELAAGCMATAMALQLNLNGPGRVIAAFGSPRQREHYLPGVADGSRMVSVAMSEPHAGSDALAMGTTLTPVDGGARWRLDGTKCYITNGDRADTVLVFGRHAGTTGPYGIGAVLIDRGTAGFEAGTAEPKMGGRGVHEATLRFDAVEVPPEQAVVAPDPDTRAGASFLLRQFNPERCGNAAMCVGVARAALEEATRHALAREQFGRPIASFQGIRWKLADMATELDAARLMVWRAARTDVDGFPSTPETAKAKLAANTMAIRVCNEAIQVLGHQGYLRTNPVERYFRDVRGMAMAGATTEVLRNMIADDVTGLRVNQRTS